MSLGKCKPQVEDPGIAHSVPPGKIGGIHDRDGQEQRDPAIGETPDSEAMGHPDAPATITHLDNPHNGSGGSHRVIDPAKVKGINP